MIGIDVVSIKRFEKFLKRDKALEKFLCDEEIKLITSTQTAAAFFASKEAISKALKTGIGKECNFKDIKIHKDKNNAPYFTLSKKIVDKFHIKETSLSITHDHDLAIAVAVIIFEKISKTPIFH